MLILALLNMPPSIHPEVPFGLKVPEPKSGVLFTSPEGSSADVCPLHLRVDFVNCVFLLLNFSPSATGITVF